MESSVALALGWWTGPAARSEEALLGKYYPIILSMTTTQFSRISITLPPATLAAADELARALDRPRSWVVAEAIRRFAAGNPPPAGASLESPWSDHAHSGEPADRVLAFARYVDYHGWRERGEVATATSGEASHAAARLSAHLTAEGVRFVLVEEADTGLTGEPNSGAPIVVLIEASTENAAAALRALNRAGYRFADESIAAQLAGCAAMVFGVSPRVDVLTVVGTVGYADRTKRDA
jgi:hypothetical protein